MGFHFAIVETPRRITSSLLEFSFAFFSINSAKSPFISITHIDILYVLSCDLYFIESSIILLIIEDLPEPFFPKISKPPYVIGAL